ncbi:MAG: prenyltransferase/squalene oxidase repeat-containing protein, partial [Pirellula sp.]
GGGMAIEPSFPASVVWVPDSMATDGNAADPLGADPLGADPSQTEARGTEARGAETGESNQPTSPAPQPWQAPIAKPFEQIDAPKLGPVETAVAAMAATAVALPEWVEMPEPSDYALEELLELAGLDPKPETQQEPTATETATATPTAPGLAIVPIASETIANAATGGTQPAGVRSGSLRSVPPAYRMRVSPNRTQFAYQNGGDAQTEAAVQRALQWLAAAQSEDGSWNAAKHGAGLEDASKRVAPEGMYRADAGKRANTAMTGLALLAFLGAGHTHDEGPYATTVLKGLQYLRSQQFPSGDLSGRDQIGQEPTVRYARMYSHGMASLALAEAYAMTGDAQWLSSIQASARYSLSAMNPRTGGWRYDYASEDPGDTSQFGWQAMLLNSASSSGAIELSGKHRLVMQYFLDSVSTGRAGGLAVYRNIHLGTRPNPAAATHAMTAEALAMRCLLGYPVTMQASAEAREWFLRKLPGQGEENLYYWYYATLALYQLRDGRMSNVPGSHEAPANEAWNRWNAAMKQQLCSTQIGSGPQVGSWDPNCIWGAYGGRVYSTAVACMCLEVYYRYLPMYHDPELAAGTATGMRK